MGAIDNIKGPLSYQVKKLPFDGESWEVRGNELWLDGEPLGLDVDFHESRHLTVGRGIKRRVLFYAYVGNSMLVLPVERMVRYVAPKEYHMGLGDGDWGSDFSGDGDDDSESPE